MATSSAQIKKTASQTEKTEKTKRPALTDAEARKQFSARSNKLLKRLGKLAQSYEKIMRNPRASPAQREAFERGSLTLISRVERAARGEVSAPQADLVPNE